MEFPRVLIHGRLLGELVLILLKLLNGFLKERLLRLGWALGQAQYGQKLF